MPSCHRAFETRREWPYRIGASIDGNLCIDPKQLAVAIGIGRYRIKMLPAIGAGRQMLATIFGPSKRLSEGHRKPRDAKFFSLQNAFVAKSSTDVGRNCTDGTL